MATKAKPQAKPKASANGIPPDVLTLAEAAAFLRVSEAGLRTDAEAGRVPGRAVGGEWRFSLAGLVQWLRNPPAVGAMNDRQLSAIGSFQDDDTLTGMVEEIYRRRDTHPVGG